MEAAGCDSDFAPECVDGKQLIVIREEGGLPQKLGRKSGTALKSRYNGEESARGSLREAGRRYRGEGCAGMEAGATGRTEAGVRFALRVMAMPAWPRT